MVKAYIWYKRKTLFFFALVAGIFTVVLALYGYPVEAVGYAAILSCAAGAVIGIYDFLKFCVRHSQLRHMEQQIRYEIASLPQPQDQIEQDYQNLLRSIHEEKTHEGSDRRSGQRPAGE